MGREIKRVALDFDYPINKMIWKGYYNPYTALKCGVCEGTGYSPEYRKLEDDWYGFDRPQNRWCNDITQDEVQALVDAGRLMDFTHDFTENGWQKKDPEYVPTAKEVNEWSKQLFGHDAINRWICCKTRAKRIGIENIECDCCKGDGVLWADEKYKKLSEEWQPIEPPAGEGYQLWSTTSEGTPMSPVFDAPDKLAKWLADNSASTFGSGTATFQQWFDFITQKQWCVSAVFKNGILQDGVTAI